MLKALYGTSFKKLDIFGAVSLSHCDLISPHKLRAVEIYWLLHVSGGHQEMLWGVLQMIHLWETFPRLDFYAGCGRGAAPCKGVTLQINKRRSFPHGGEGTTENLWELWVWKAYLGSQKDWRVTWWSTPGGIIRKMGHVRLSKSSKLEVVGFSGETPHAHLLLCRLPLGDRTWTEWARFRTCCA